MRKVYIIRTKKELNKFISTHKLVKDYVERLKYQAPEEIFSLPTAFSLDICLNRYVPYCEKHNDTLQELKEVYIFNYGKNYIEFVNNLGLNLNLELE